MAKEKPDENDVFLPWTVVDCDCNEGCTKCDGFRWYYSNEETGQNLSEMMRDAFERHG